MQNIKDELFPGCKQQTERMLTKMSKLTPEQREKVLIFMYGVEAGAQPARKEALACEKQQDTGKTWIF